MKRALLLTVAWTGALVAIPMPAHAAAPPGIHYTVVRVATGDAGPLPSDKEVTNAVAYAARFWRTVPGAPPLQFTIVHGVVSGKGTAPSCGMDVGRAALGLSADQGTITFLPTGYSCFGDGTARAPLSDIDIEARTALSGRDLAHEIGHNLGFDHDRTREQFPWAPGYSLYEYGNQFSLMGGGEGPPSAWQQAALGWMPVSAFPTGKPVRLYAISSGGGAGDLRFDKYDLEYRPGYGVVVYDAHVLSHMNRGADVLKPGQVYAGVKLVSVRPGYVWLVRA